MVNGSEFANVMILSPDATDLIFTFTAQEIVLREQKYIPTFAETSLIHHSKIKYYCFAYYHGQRCLLVEDTQLILKDSAFCLVNLRNCYELLNQTEYELAILGKQLLHWRLNSRYCGYCGGSVKDQADERARLCPQCNSIQYPRLSPVVIVLITRGEEVLLARSPHFKAGVFSALAGFVEPGESLEHAVQREVREEVGINIKNMVYHSSQPWPYPDSLMIGFIAEYDSGEIVIDPKEIEAAAWFELRDLPPLPSPVSIAYHLIETILKLKSQDI